MTLATRTRRLLRYHWADRLGVAPGAFDRAGVAVGTATGVPAGDVQLFVREGSALVGAPEELVGALRGAAGGLADRDAGDPAAVRAWAENRGVAVDRVLGPTVFCYADRDSFAAARPRSRARVRPLDDGDESAFEALRAAVPDGEWDDGGPSFVPGRTVGLFEVEGVGDDVARDRPVDYPAVGGSGDGGADSEIELVAAAGYGVVDDLLAQLSVVVHPDRRGRRYGRAVVSRAARAALNDGLLPQYRTLADWPWSVELARALGFETFGTGLLVVTADED